MKFGGDTMPKEMVSLRILVPDATINYIQNPSFRFDTTGWTAFSSTISRTLDQARFKIASLKVITSGSVLNEGVYYRVNNLVGISDPITVSAYVRGTGKVRIRLTNGIGGSQWSSKTIQLSESRWKRIEVTGRSIGGNDVRLIVESAEPTAKSITFYVDGAQMERKPYSTTYCDGDMPGCRWNIIQSASLSSRNTNTREGGKWITLSGKDRENENLYMTVVGGLGMAPIVNNTQSFAIAPGSYYQNSKVTDRVVTLTFHAKHEDLLGKEKKLSLVKLHELRQLLINTIKPDLTSGDEDFLVEYKDGDTPLYFRARYDGGLEGEWDIRNKFFNSFPLRLLVVSPFLEEDDQEVATIDFQESFNLSASAARVNGQWNNMNYGFNGPVGDLEIGRKGEIFSAGSFNIANNSVLAIDPLIPAKGITYWDGLQWRALAVSIGGLGTINDVAVAPNGDIYVTGSFTSINGVSANNIAKLSNGVWSALGTGLNGDGIHISIAPNGDLYVGGSFTTAGGVNAYRIAKWNGSSWSAIGTYGGFRDGNVQSIAISPDGTYMYVAGSFTDEFSITGSQMLRIALYTVSTNTFTQVGSGFNNNALEVIISPSGIVYVCGDFTASGTTICNRIAQLIGSSFAPLGSGMNDTVNSFDIGINGDLIAVGEFTTSGGIPARGIALWNGSSWVNLDILISADSSTSPTILGVQFSANGDFYIGGFNTSNTQSKFSGITTVTNLGSSEVSPFMYILGSGALRWIENQTTKKRLFLNMQILDGEEVFIDFGKGTVESTVRGSLLSFVLPGSDFNDFTLIPGENKIACLITNDVGATVKMGYTPSHWSMDALG